MLPAGTLVVNYAGITSYRVIFEEQEKRRVRKLFASYLSPEVIRLIEKDPQRYFHPGGETKDLSIMFSDIRSFTTLSEGMTADQLISLLNEYLGAMTDVLLSHWGTLDKYIGDAIMAFWGSPLPQSDHASRACGCALDMMARLQELNRKWASEGRQQLRVGIGINSGPVSVGNVGSSKRLAWTVIGDDVNLASRIEGMTKEYGVRTLISASTYAQVAGEYVCRELDLIRVKGKFQPVAIYELLARKQDADQFSDLLARFQDARNSYRECRWNEAIGKFEDLLRYYPVDRPALLFLERLQEFRTNVPLPEWDGVYVMDHK
jgi:adenylate cyclase